MFGRVFGFTLVVAVLVAATSHPAAAYIGPGAGLSVIGTLVALLGAVLLAIVGFVWYPVKRMMAKLRKAKGPDQPSRQS